MQGVLLTRSEAETGPLPENPEFVWELVREGLEAALKRWTIADLSREAARRGVDRAETEPAMYHI